MLKIGMRSNLKPHTFKSRRGYKSRLTAQISASLSTSRIAFAFRNEQFGTIRANRSSGMARQAARPVCLVLHAGGTSGPRRGSRRVSAVPLAAVSAATADCVRVHPHPRPHCQPSDTTVAYMGMLGRP